MLRRFQFTSFLPLLHQQHQQYRKCSTTPDSPDFASMQTLASSDAFAKPRFTNYIKRFPCQVDSNFRNRKIDSSWFRCETKVPIFFPGEKQPDRVATAVGFGKTEKEAENACAMHAERILDAAGAELFALGTMQARHAEAALKDGRWARFPKNHLKRGEQENEAHERRNEPPLIPPLIIVGTDFVAPEGKSPKSRNEQKSSNTTNKTGFNTQNNDDDLIEIITLEDTKGADDAELQHEGIEIDKAEFADWRLFPHAVKVNCSPPSSLRHLDESENGKNWLVEFGMYYENEPNTLLSPHVFCPDSLDRVRKFFQHQYFGDDDAFDDLMETEQLPFAAWSSERVELIKKKVKFVDPSNPEKHFEAIGVSRDERRAVQLCAMHAELLIDYHGFKLFPQDEARQEQHADECRRLGRWAISSSSPTKPENLMKQHREGPPKPLREWGDSTKPKTMGRSFGRSVMHQRRAATLTEEEFFLHCHSRNLLPYHLIELNPTELIANGKGEKLIQDLRELFKFHGEKREAFYLNYDYGGMWRCTFLLPMSTKTYGIRGGYGLGFTKFEARCLAAFHTVEILCTFGLPLYPQDFQKQLAFEKERREKGLFVIDRDPETGEILNPVPPKVRSPPGLRSLKTLREPENEEKPHHHQSEDLISGAEEPTVSRLDGIQISPFLLSRKPSAIPRYDDWRAAQMIDASIFTVADVSGNNFDYFLFKAFKTYCKNIGAVQEPQLCYYFGLQPVKGHFLVSANTVFASIPFPLAIQKENFEGASTIYAVGRHEDRKSAEKLFYIHALKIIDHLGLLHLCCEKEEQEHVVLEEDETNEKEQLQARILKPFKKTNFPSQKELERKFKKKNLSQEEYLELTLQTIRNCFESCKPKRLVVQQDYGAAIPWTGQEFSWGNSWDALYPPLRPLDEKGNPVQSVNMRHLPCPLIGPVIAERCFCQTHGAKQHKRLRCA